MEFRPNTPKYDFFELRDKSPAKNVVQKDQEAPREYPKLFTLSLMTMALMVAVFLVAIEGSILGAQANLISPRSWECSTATPKITAQFHSLDDVAWYAAGYQMSNMALQPTYGRLYTYFRLKIVFTVAVTLFCIGTIISATASSSAILIFGRVTQGSGAAGIFGGALSMGTFLVPKQKLPLYISIVSSVYALAAALGPVLGGLFADSSLTWRFGFWFNLPIAAVALATILSVFPEPTRAATQLPLKEKLASLDPVGACLLIAAVTCLLLALQWGGVSLPWSDSAVIGCLIAFVILLMGFLIIQAFMKEKASVPIRILTQRSVAASCIFACGLGAAVATLDYYLPFYFQRARGLSARTSGLYILPWAVTSTFLTFISGAAITVTGIYVPWMILGSGIMIAGCALLVTLDVASPTAQVVGYQLLASIGFGLCVQVPLTAMRAILAEEDMPTGNALFVFFQGFGSAVGVSVAQTIFTNRLGTQLAEALGDKAAARLDGVVALGESVPVALVDAARGAYRDALQGTFMLAVGAAGGAFLASLLMEWKRLHKPEKRGDGSG